MAQHFGTTIFDPYFSEAFEDYNCRIVLIAAMEKSRETHESSTENVSKGLVWIGTLLEQLLKVQMGKAVGKKGQGTFTSMLRWMDSVNPFRAQSKPEANEPMTQEQADAFVEAIFKKNR